MKKQQYKAASIISNKLKLHDINIGITLLMTPTKDDIRTFLLSVLSKSEFKDSKAKKAVLSLEEQIQVESNKQNLKAVSEFVNSDWLHHKFLYQPSDLKRKPRKLKNKLYNPKLEGDEELIPTQVESHSENSKYTYNTF